MNIDINIVLVAVFLVVSLWLGLRAGRGITTFKKFALGDKNFTTSVLTATILATYLGGDFIYLKVENIYNSGLYYIIPMLLSILEIYFIGQFLALRMGEFLNDFSIAESMGNLYGARVRSMTALGGILYAICIIAMQFQVIGRVITLCLGLQGNVTLYLAVLVVLTYSILGGIKSVTLTDVLQFMTFSTLIPILIWLVARKLGKVEDIATMLAYHENFDWATVAATYPQSVDMYFLILLNTIPNLTPDMVQRIYMSTDVWQAKRIFINAARISLVMASSVVVLGLFLLTVNSELDPEKLMEFILSQHPLVGVRGLVCIGLLALAMSTADSLLNAASVLFAHDITGALGITIKKEKTKLVVARMFIFFVGLFALYIALQGMGLLQVLLLGVSFCAPVSMIFLMAILGFRPSKKIVLISLGASAFLYYFVII